MQDKQRLPFNRTDFYLVSFIGASFALFSVPIIINLDITLIRISFITVVGLIILFVIFANIALAIAWFIGKYIPVVFQFAKFAAVGAFNTFLDWGILNLLIAMTHIADGVGFSLFKGISFTFATVSAYYWNKYWTFGATNKSNKEEVTKFIGISVGGLIINVSLASLIIYFFNGKTTVTPEQLANIAAATATLASLVWNFLGYKFLVFKK